MLNDSSNPMTLSASVITTFTENDKCTYVGISVHPQLVFPSIFGITTDTAYTLRKYIYSIMVYISRLIHSQSENST